MSSSQNFTSGALYMVSLSLLLLVTPARALSIPTTLPNPPVPVILCLSVTVLSLVVLLVPKVIYVKLRRNNSSASNISSKTPFPLLVGMLGSPDWEINRKTSVCPTEKMIARMSGTSQSGFDTFPPLDEFGITCATRRVNACPRSLIPSLPALAHIPAWFENNSAFSLPLLPIIDPSPHSLRNLLEESAKIRSVPMTSQLSYDSASFLSVASKFSTPGFIHRNPIPPSKLKTKHLYRKTPPMSFLPIQTPPDSPLSGSESLPVHNTVFRFAGHNSSSVIVQHISHPYADSQPVYDFPRSPDSYDSKSPSTNGSPINSEYTSKLPLLNHTRRNLTARGMNLPSGSPFFSSVSLNTSPLSSEKTVTETTTRANVKLIPFSSTGIGKMVSDRTQCIPSYAFGATPSIPYEFTSFLDYGPCLSPSASHCRTLCDVQGLENPTGNGLGQLSEINGDSSEMEKPRVADVLFSILEEDIQSRSSKSFNRLSSANATSRRNSNTAYADVGLVVTALSGSAASVTPRKGFSVEIDRGVVDDNVVADVGEDEESRACLMGLMEELEEWGCEWVNNEEPQNGTGW